MKHIRFVLVFLVLCIAATTPALASEVVTQARRDYQFQLEKYREEYKIFDLKRAQYTNLQTAASEEELVTAARTMLVRRDQVWHTYLQAIRTELSESTGLDLAERDLLAQDIIDWQTTISEHQKSIEALKLHDELLGQAVLFNGWNKELQSLSYRTLSQIAWGRLRAQAINQVDLTARIKAAVTTQIREADIRETRLRGFTEVDRSLNLAQLTLIDVKLKNKGFEFGGSDNLDSVYKKIVTEMLPAHEQLTRAYTLLSELSTGTEL